MTKLIDRYNTLSMSKCQGFTTAEDYQDYTNIHANKIERGVPELKVTFNIDFNGILEFKAEDMQPHQKCPIQIVMSYIVDLLHEGTDYSCFLVRSELQ